MSTHFIYYSLQDLLNLWMDRDYNGKIIKLHKKLLADANAGLLQK